LERQTASHITTCSSWTRLSARAAFRTARKLAGLRATRGLDAGWLAVMEITTLLVVPWPPATDADTVEARAKTPPAAWGGCRIFDGRPPASH
jgi:hypothetical protein